jgi:hypothetical protein
MSADFSQSSFSHQPFFDSFSIHPSVHAHSRQKYPRKKKRGEKEGGHLAPDSVPATNADKSRATATSKSGGMYLNELSFELWTFNEVQVSNFFTI